MSDDGALAHAAATIADLRQQLADKDTSLVAALADAEHLREQQAAARPVDTAEISRLRARVTELEALVTVEPPQGWGIVKVERYMTSDGHKWKTLPEAQHQATKLGLMADLGVDELTAQLLIDKRTRITDHLSKVP